MIALPKRVLAFAFAFALLPLEAASAQAPAPAPASTPAPAPAAGSAEAAALEFVAALNALDPARLGRVFAENSTIFFPGPPFPVRRVEGKADAMLYFTRFFEALRARGVTRANIRPLDLDVRGDGDAAVATFHLNGGDDVGRRTLVLRRRGAVWLVVHLHASSLDEPVEAARAAS